MAEQQFKGRPKTALDDLKFRLQGEKVLEGGKYPPTLSVVQITNGNPAVEVWLNNGEQGQKGKIQLNMDPYAVEWIFEAIDEATRQKEKCKFSLPVLSSYKFGKKLDKPEVFETLVVGRTDEGGIYIGVIAKGKPAVRFFFEAPTWFERADAEGNALPTNVNDRIWARAWLNAVRRIWSIRFEKQWLEPSRDGAKNSYNKQNSQQSSYNNPSAPSNNSDFEESFDDSW